MSFTPEIDHRRSQRVLIDLPLLVRGESANGRPDFREETFTLTVSAHGALVMMENKVALGQKVVLVNPKNSDEREGKVSYVGPDRAGLAKVAVEFMQPAPEFWPVPSPPQNWYSSGTTGPSSS
jgi:hypothetical protein